MSYTYAEATWSQQLPDWIASHVRCFEFMGCVAALLVPDNLKSAIKLACRYEPEATSTYVPAPVDWTRFSSSGGLSDGISLTRFVG